MHTLHALHTVMTRFKSMQRRNMIEVRVKQKTVKKLKIKKYEKR